MDVLPSIYLFFLFVFFFKKKSLFFLFIFFSPFLSPLSLLSSSLLYAHYNRAAQRRTGIRTGQAGHDMTWHGMTWDLWYDSPRTRLVVFHTTYIDMYILFGIPPWAAHPRPDGARLAGIPIPSMDHDPMHDNQLRGNKKARNALERVNKRLAWQLAKAMDAL